MASQAEHPYTRQDYLISVSSTSTACPWIRGDHNRERLALLGVLDGDWGLAVHLALVAMAGELGMDIDLPLIPGSAGLKPNQKLYSESCGRFVITVAPRKKERFEEIFSGMNMERVGAITEPPLFTIRSDKGEPIIREDVFRLKDLWKRPFGELI